MWWKEPVTTLKGVGVKKAAELAALNIFSVGDLLEFYPRQGAYLDYAKLKTIKELDVDNSKQIFKATVYQVKNGYGASRRSYTSVTVRDETGYATLQGAEAEAGYAVADYGTRKAGAHYEVRQ